MTCKAKVMLAEWYRDHGSLYHVHENVPGNWVWSSEMDRDANNTDSGDYWDALRAMKQDHKRRAL